jgi:large subunit ribosomal protein L16
MLQPSRVKFRKVHKGQPARAASRGVELAFGAYGLKAEESTWVKANQLESARRAMARLFQRGGKIWTRVFPHKPRTSKSAEVGMGGGAGSLSHFVAVIEAGRVLFEIDGVTEAVARQALKLAAAKLPLKTKFISRT